MRSVPEEEFLAWAANLGVVVNPAYRHNWRRDLSFSTDQEISRYWVIPKEAQELDWFIELLFEAISPWKKLCLWPRSGGFLAEAADSEYWLERLLVTHVKGIWQDDDALELSEGEVEHAYPIIFSAATFGWSWPNDLFVVPDNGEVFLFFDHHHVVWAHFKSSQRCAEFVDGLRKLGIELPSSAPDETFKLVDWMTNPSKIGS